MPLRLNCDIVYSQVDLEQEQEIKCIATQGRQTHNQWLTNYQIEYSSEGNDWKFYEENNGEVKVIYCNGLECRLFPTVGVEHEAYIWPWSMAVMTSYDLHTNLREENITGKPGE